MHKFAIRGPTRSNKSCPYRTLRALQYKGYGKKSTRKDDVDEGEHDHEWENNHDTGVLDKLAENEGISRILHSTRQIRSPFVTDY